MKPYSLLNAKLTLTLTPILTLSLTMAALWNSGLTPIHLCT